MKGDVRQLLGFLGARYERAQGDVDELRLRALELVIAACVSAENRTGGGEPEAAAAPAAPVLSEADLAAVPQGPEPSRDPEAGPSHGRRELPPEPEPPRTRPEPRPDHTEEKPPVPPPEQARPGPPSAPPPPVSPDPAVEDVRGAWGPPGLV